MAPLPAISRMHAHVLITADPYTGLISARHRLVNELSRTGLVHARYGDDRNLPVLARRPRTYHLTEPGWDCRQRILLVPECHAKGMSVSGISTFTQLPWDLVARLITGQKASLLFSRQVIKKMVRLYTREGATLEALAAAVPVRTTVVRQMLEEQNVTIRPAGFQRRTGTPTSDL